MTVIALLLVTGMRCKMLLLAIRNRDTRAEQSTKFPEGQKSFPC